MSEICTTLINPTGMFCEPTRECLDKLIKGHTQITEASDVYPPHFPARSVCFHTVSSI